MLQIPRVWGNWQLFVFKLNAKFAVTIKSVIVSVCYRTVCKNVLIVIEIFMVTVIKSAKSK